MEGALGRVWVSPLWNGKDPERDTGERAADAPSGLPGPHHAVYGYSLKIGVKSFALILFPI